MKTLLKMLIGAAIVLAVALAGGLWWLSHSLGPLVASAIRTHGPEITGVAVRIDSVAIAPFSGTAELRGLVVGSPGGFHADHALSLGEFSMSLSLRSLLADVIVVKRIVIVKPDIMYEVGPGGSNLQAIQRNVDHYAGGPGAAPAKAPVAKQSGGGKKLVIDDLFIKDATAHVSASVLRSGALSVPLPDLHLHAIGRASNGATAGEAVRQVLAALTKSVTAAVAKANLGQATKQLQKSAGSAGGMLKGLLKK
jgi:uncharacterized protein involved in outer membrane biogenesis